MATKFSTSELYWYIDNATGLPNGPFTSDERAEIGEGTAWTWLAADPEINPEFTFVVDGVETLIVAADEAAAMKIANRAITVPDNFYAWMKGADFRFRATTGAWD